MKFVEAIFISFQGTVVRRHADVMACGAFSKGVFRVPPYHQLKE